MFNDLSKNSTIGFPFGNLLFIKNFAKLVDFWSNSEYVSVSSPHINAVCVGFFSTIFLNMFTTVSSVCMFPLLLNFFMISTASSGKTFSFDMFCVPDNICFIRCFII